MRSAISELLDNHLLRSAPQWVTCNSSARSRTQPSFGNLVRDVRRRGLLSARICRRTPADDAIAAVDRLQLERHTFVIASNIDQRPARLHKSFGFRNAA